MIHFEIKATDKKAHTGIFEVKGKEVQTPCFMPSGTGLNLKAMFPETIGEIGFPVIYGDLYHPLMRMGLDSIFKQGGLKKVTNYEDCLLMLGSGADGIEGEEGAYKAKEDGVSFSSYIDGSKHKLSPESSIRISKKLGADIVTGLYECPMAAAGNRKKLGGAVRRTSRWTKRAIEIFNAELGKEAKEGNVCFFVPIVGGAQGDLRIQSAREAAKYSPDGFVQTAPLEGEPRKAWFMAMEASMAMLPEDKPIAVLGVNGIDELLRAIAMGADFVAGDFPFTDGLKGIVYTKNGKIDLNEKKFFEDKGRIEEGCLCPACKDYTLAYMHHLFSAEELLGPRFAVWHNLVFVQKLMEEIRSNIAKSGG